jgi:hypothetical protein
MRVMVLVKATEDSEKGEYAGHEEEFAAMGRYNQELLKAGIMLAGEGLAPSSQGGRLEFGDDGGRRVIDGPASSATSLISAGSSPKRTTPWTKSSSTTTSRTTYCG